MLCHMKQQPHERFCEQLSEKICDKRIFEFAGSAIRFPGYSPSDIYPSQIFSKTFLHRTNAYLNFYPSWIFTHHVLPIRKNPYLDLYPSQFCPSIGGFLPIRTLPMREQPITQGKTKNSLKNQNFSNFSTVFMHKVNSKARHVCST